MVLPQNSPQRRLTGHEIRYMDLSLEVYRKIIKCVGHRADIAALCRVSKQFQYVGERVLYNTLLLRDPHLAISLCETLATQTRVAMLVDALTVQTSDEDSDEEDEEEEGDERPNRPAAGDSLPEGFWPSIARALEKTTQLRYLNIHINGSEDRAVAWILHNCTFRLKRFHCDLDWDRHLVAFLNKQINLDDLYIMDFKEPGSNFCTDMTVDADATKLPLQLDAGALPNLATLECTFSEAAMAIVPGRPITCLKTCFSRSDPRDKRAEMLVLLSKINRSTRPLRSLDIADSAYNQTFSLELLGHIVRTTTNMSQLRYLGTLVLPSSGKEVRIPTSHASPNSTEISFFSNSD
jgi:hypothetical protein